MSRPKDILTTGEVAAICKVAPRTVSKWFDSGRLKGYRIPGSKDRRIPLDQLIRFMKAHNIPLNGLEPGGLRVLIAEADHDIGELLSAALGREAGYEVDSSLGRHKLGSYFVKPRIKDGVRRIPASISPSPLRSPGPIRNLICGLLDSPAVLFFHPWEFVDLTREPLRFDIRVRTGDPALHALRETIRYYKRRDFRFLRMRDVPV